MQLLRDLRDLLALLTSLPLGGGSLEGAARAFRYVPLVGLLEGALVSLLLFLRLPPELFASLFLLSHVLVTGGIHLDGLADYSDVLGSRRRGEAALAVLKDPRKGAFGTLGLVLWAAAGFSSGLLLQELFSHRPSVALSALLMSYVLAAESMYVTLLYSREEPYEGMAKAFSEEARRGGLRANLLPLAVALALPALLFPLVLLLVPTALLLSILIAKDAEERLGFANGDVAGFAYELVRLSCLLLALLLV
ncbi:MAG: adenosylcobinamide-GDP ribazoletransferase [Acidilobaceae archaeon]|nr:adenosylcobinamide-GDP ribazoletransferase [Acidilobaceae archaeon]MCX8165843.1 adenosylcobinamide-GDP ribazoletransferase [Acidilobaceae archaeon]MDW7974851.1 adenosylcobinamide-GDP ribazoletransferase [Sulfolobales archaeon]